MITGTHVSACRVTQRVIQTRSPSHVTRSTPAPPDVRSTIPHDYGTHLRDKMAAAISFEDFRVDLRSNSVEHSRNASFRRERQALLIPPVDARRYSARSAAPGAKTYSFFLSLSSLTPKKVRLMSGS